MQKFTDYPMHIFQCVTMTVSLFSPPTNAQIEPSNVRQCVVEICFEGEEPILISPSDARRLSQSLASMADDIERQKLDKTANSVPRVFRTFQNTALPGSFRIDADGVATGPIKAVDKPAELPGREVPDADAIDR